jgi:hypothetical protein
MKKTSVIAAACLMTASLALLTAKTNAQTKEDQAIEKVIEQESVAYFHKNYDAWADTWAHDSADYILRASPTGYQQVLGWNAIATEYKQDIQNLPVRTETEIAPFLHKTDYHIYVNGNMATARFKEGDKVQNVETRDLVKQDGNWKILNFTLIDNHSYTMRDVVNRMKAFVGQWELDGKATMEPSDGGELNSLKINLDVTPNGLKQLSDFSYSMNGHFYTPPTEYEYFIPDYGSSTVSYLDVTKNASGQTFTRTGKVTSDGPDSFTVTVMYPDKPDAIDFEYTVTMQNGKWRQVNKRFNQDGKLISTATANLRRVQ